MPDINSSRLRIFAGALALLALWGIVCQLGSLFLPETCSDARNPLNFWWAVHIALAWQLVRPRSSTWIFAVAISWLEAVIRAGRVTLFLINPEWRLLPAMWFGQHAAALLLFLLLARFLHSSADGRALRNLR